VRRLPGAIRPDDGHELTGGDTKREAAEDVVVAIAGKEVMDFEERHGFARALRALGSMRGHVGAPHVPREASSTRGSRRTSAKGPSMSLRPWAMTMTGSQSSVT